MAFRALRTIRGQLIASLVLFELVALVFFSAVLFKERSEEAKQRMLRRLEYQVSELQVVSRLALRDHDMEMLHTVVTSMLQFPTIASVAVTDPSGVAIAASDARLNGTPVLTPFEHQIMPDVHALRILALPDGERVAVMPVQLGGQPAAYIWIYPQDGAARTDFKEALRVSVLGAIAVILACTMLAALIAASLTRPLTRLLAATRSIIQNPEDTSAFPLQVVSRNEAADLTIAFNLMVASIEEQRSGLSDTLALLDSMLANAPIGIAFFDRQSRFVRVNHFLAESHALGVARYLGRRVDEVFTPEAAAALSLAIEQIFEQGDPVQGLEISGSDVADTDPALDGHKNRSESRTWLVNVYPVRTGGQQVRWAGVVLIDITQRLRTEQALRETEKLAVTGRLSASIAHEINNPLEAVTNLLYLLRHHGALGPQATEWADAAQHEVARVSDITQQTLRFYRQSSRPGTANLTELLDSVLTLHQGRVATLQVELDRRYRDPGELLCFTGELRQLFANLIGNALDAMQPSGGRLTISVRESRSWRDSGNDLGNYPVTAGVRVTIADTGCGMSQAVRRRIFEPFYTTKEATGTGLGLWVSSEIMTKHKVILHIRSRERAACVNPAADGHAQGGGTVFMLFFPAVIEEIQASAEPVEAASFQ
jgi:PAS domain S-box-containing protein